MPYLFGQSFTYGFYPVQEQDYVDLSTVTDDPAVYIYKEGYKPTRADASAGTDNGGLLQSITTWTDGTNCKEIAVAPISDPDPTSNIEERTYWIGLNVPLQDGGTKQTIVRALPMQRVTAHHKGISAAAADLKSVFGSIDSYASSTEQTAAISTATIAIKAALEMNRFSWAEIWRPDKLKDAVVYKALYFLMLSEVAQQGDRWDVLAKAYDSTAETLLAGLRLEFVDEPDEDPKDEEPVQVESGFRRFIR